MSSLSLTQISTHAYTRPNSVFSVHSKRGIHKPIQIYHLAHEHDGDFERQRANFATSGAVVDVQDPIQEQVDGQWDVDDDFGMLTRHLAVNRRRDRDDVTSVEGAIVLTC